jgi:hypothetical protein
MCLPGQSSKVLNVWHPVAMLGIVYNANMHVCTACIMQDTAESRMQSPLIDLAVPNWQDGILRNAHVSCTCNSTVASHTLQKANATPAAPLGTLPALLLVQCVHQCGTTCYSQARTSTERRHPPSGNLAGQAEH